jgi:hypothetical protein
MKEYGGDKEENMRRWRKERKTKIDKIMEWLKTKRRYGER